MIDETETVSCARRHASWEAVTAGSATLLVVSAVREVVSRTTYDHSRTAKTGATEFLAFQYARRSSTSGIFSAGDVHERSIRIGTTFIYRHHVRRTFIFSSSKRE